MQGSRWPFCFFLPAVAVLAFCSTAQAQNWSLHGIADGSTSYSDNIFTTDPGETDMVYTVAPSLLYMHEARRSVHELTYGLNGRLYQRNSQANSWTHNALWRLARTISQRTGATFSVSGATGTVNQLAATDAATPGATNQQAGTRFTSFSAAQGLRYDLNSDWSTTQSLTAGYNQQTSADLGEMSQNGEGKNVSFGLNAARAWSRDSIALGTTAGYSNTIAAGTDAAGMERREESVLASITGTWRRDINPFWSSSASLGWVAVIPIVDKDGFFYDVRPVGNVNLRYARRDGSTFGLSAGYAVTQTIIAPFSNTQTINSGLSYDRPLLLWSRDPSRPEYRFATSVTFSRQSIINLEGDPDGGGADSLFANAGIAWRAPRRRIGVSMNYAYVRQKPTDDVAGFFAYTANTITFNITGQYPSRIAAEFPRPSVRVDRSDEIQVGGGSSESAPAQRTNE